MEDRTKELKENKDEIKEIETKLKTAQSSLEKEELENKDLQKEIKLTGETMKKSQKAIRRS